MPPEQSDLAREILKDPYDLEFRPKSVYALAKATGRPLKNTQNDVAMLARLDLVELKRGRGKRSPLEPRVRYDSIRLDIPLHDAR